MMLHLYTQFDSDLRDMIESKQGQFLMPYDQLELKGNAYFGG